MHTDSLDEPDNLYPPSSLGINLPPGINGEGISVTLTGNFNLGAVNPNGQDYKNWHFRDSMSWINGRHTFKWGYEAHKIDWILNSKYTQTRSATFSGVRPAMRSPTSWSEPSIRSTSCSDSPAANRSYGSTSSISRTSSR